MTATDPPDLVIRGAELGGGVVDVRLGGGRVVAIAPRGTTIGGADRVLDADGGALLPGLHDHHLHLLAMAAALESVDGRGRDLDGAIRAAHASRPPDEWLRVVGYDDAAAGPLDRERLDALAPGRPVRVQHRSGAAWILSSTALERLDLDAAPDGVERAAGGRPTGRLFRLDRWLADHLPRGPVPDLAPVGRALVSRGVTGVTDATPSSDPSDVDLLAAAVTDRRLPLAVMVTGGIALADRTPASPLLAGPVKVVVTDHELPRLDDLEQVFDAAHRAGRSVAVHCVSDVALVLALAAWDAVGTRPGDRVEHGSVIHPAHVDRLSRHGLTVVTQPGFVHESGDRYLADVDPTDVSFLYRCGSLLAAGVAVGGSTDAPFGPGDPWLGIATAVDRRTRAGATLGRGERVDPATALDLFLAPLSDPGGPPRRPAIGAPADLCLLDRTLGAALGDPSAVAVVATIVGGEVVHHAA